MNTSVIIPSLVGGLAGGLAYHLSEKLKDMKVFGAEKWPYRLFIGVIALIATVLTQYFCQ